MTPQEAAWGPVVKGLLCKWLGHRWASVASYAPKAYYCTRCGESGTWVR